MLLLGVCCSNYHSYFLWNACANPNLQLGVLPLLSQFQILQLFHKCTCTAVFIYTVYTPKPSWSHLVLQLLSDSLSPPAYCSQLSVRCDYSLELMFAGSNHGPFWGDHQSTTSGGGDSAITGLLTKKRQKLLVLRHTIHWKGCSETECELQMFLTTYKCMSTNVSILMDCVTQNYRWPTTVVTVEREREFKMINGLLTMVVTLSGHFLEMHHWKPMSYYLPGVNGWSI